MILRKMMMKKTCVLAAAMTLLLLTAGSAQEESKKYPGDAMGYLYGAQYYESQNNFEKAHALYDLCATENPKLVDPRFFKSQLFIRQDKLEDALKVLEGMKTMTEMEWVTAEFQDLNVDAAITATKKKIQEKLKAENPVPPKKKKWWDKLSSFDFSGEKKGSKEEKPAGKSVTKEQKTVPAVTHYLNDTRVKVFKGEKDGLKTGDELILVDGQHIVGKAKLIEVKSFHSTAELLDFEPVKTYAEGDVLASKYYLLTAPAEQKEP